MKFISKSIFIEAIQFNGRNLDEIMEFCEDSNIIEVDILNNMLVMQNKSPDYANPLGQFAQISEWLVKDPNNFIMIYQHDIFTQHWLQYK
jgi:hypothetical protein